MLRKLIVSNYAIIEHVEINFTHPFSVFSGETGAGKSIILEAIGLVLGDRADISALRNNEQKCVIEAVLTAPDSLKSVFEALDVDFEHETILRREITTSGRSRSFVNDTPINQQDLRSLGQQLLDIHHQHENVKLMDPAFQLGIIDGFADHKKALTTYMSTYTDYSAKNTELEALQRNLQNDLKEKDFLEYQLEEINNFNPQTSDAELEEQFNVQANAEKIKSAVNASEQLLDAGNTGVLDLLAELQRQLQAVQDVNDKYGELYNRVTSSLLELQDLSNEIQLINNDLEFGQDEFIRMEQRLDQLNAMLTKHGLSSVQQLLELKNELESKLHGETSSEERIAALSNEVETLRAKLQEQGSGITSTRLNVIERLCSELQGLLKELGMPEACIVIDHETLQEPGTKGWDQFTWKFSANEGFEPQPLKSVASGGELARLALGMKHLYARTQQLPTIIFDEIDTGVSGEIADKIGQLMRALSGNTQVITITHSPQVAARGDQHYLISKHKEGSITNSTVTLLDETQRLEELAKMLSGSTLTKEARDNARILLSAN